MKVNEIHSLLEQMFLKELTNDRKRHVVFWYDAEGEFSEDIKQIELDDVRLWEVTDHNLFATKYELETNDTESHFLLYFQKEKPNPREDWLYSIYKLGQEFATDKITIIMRELGITNDALRSTFKQYHAFFNSRARLESFTRFPVESYTEEMIDLTVLAALSKSRTNTLDDVIKAILSGQVHSQNEVWDDIRKFGNEEKFWLLLEKYFGYSLQEKTLDSLAKFLIITYLAHQLPTEDIPVKWEKYTSPRPTNVIVFMNQWMNHQEDRAIYNTLADNIAFDLNVKDMVDKWDILDEIVHMDSFRQFDEEIIIYLNDQLINDLIPFETIDDVIYERRRLHWHLEYSHEYEAIYQATNFMRMMYELDYFIPEEPANQMFQSYVKEYAPIDTAYRKFYIAYDKITSKERLHLLRAKVENLYTNKFISELAIKWTHRLTRNGESWTIPNIPQQKDFYQDWVKPFESNDERVFIIISDALRYEVANELMNELNNERKASTKINAIQSVLPSYTALGMAALLPHEKISYTEKGDIKLDGFNTIGIENRNYILRQTVPESLAISFADVGEMNRQQFRTTFSGKKVIYIYHNSIDAHGDNAATEMDVFQAADEAIRDIRKLVNRLVNNVSATNIIITADHGFLYQRDAVTESQKIPQHKEDVLHATRRFVLSKDRLAIEGTLTYSMDDTIQQADPLYVTVPRGTTRFAIQGAGANYVHGGAMLQEIVVPVITFKNDRSKSTINEVRKVDVKLTTPTRKVTNEITYLEFFQLASIGDKITPRHLRVYFADEDGQRISNEQIIIAEHATDEAGMRTFRERFVFRTKAYDRKKTYYLIMQDIDEKDDEIYERYAFTIDISLRE